MNRIRIQDLDERRRVLAFDLKDILSALRPKATRSFWSVGAVEEGAPDGLDVTGEVAAELEGLAQSGERVNGRRFLKLAQRIRQVIWGEFRGYDSPSSTTPWIIIIAFDSAWFEVRSADEDALARLKAAFKDVRPS